MAFTKKLLTKKEIITAWQDRHPKTLNAPCCPDCRDTLIEDETDAGRGLACSNYMCNNNDLFDLEPDPEYDDKFGKHYRIIGRSNK